MAFTIQTCVRTEAWGDDTVYEGALVLADGTWYFCYDEVDRHIRITWASSSAQVLPTNSKVLLRVWNSDSTIVNCDMKSRKNRLIMEETIDLSETTELQKFVEVKLDEYLVFAVEGSGPAVSNVDNGLIEKLKKAEAALAQEKKQSMDERAALKKDFEKKEAANLKELNAVKIVKSRFEKIYTTLVEGEKANEEERKKLKDARDDLETKFQKLENEKEIAEKAVESAIQEIKRNEKSLIELKKENKNLNDELAELRQTLIPENKRLASENDGLKKATKSWESKYDKEAAKNIENAAKNVRLESQKNKLDRDTREAKQKLNDSEKLKSSVESKLDRALGDLKSMETKFKDKEREFKQLSRESRAEKSYLEAARAELKLAQDQRHKEDPETEHSVRDLEIKVGGMESQIKALLLSVQDLEEEKSKLSTVASKEEGIRLGAERENERLKAALQKFEDNLSAAENKVSSLNSDLEELNSTLEAYQCALTNEKGIRTKQFDELKKERSGHSNTRGKLEGLQKTSEARIAKLNGDAKSANDVVKELEKAKLDAEKKAEEKQRDLNKIQANLDKKGKLLKEEQENIIKLKEKLKKAAKRELEYDPERLHEQLDSEKAAHKANVVDLTEKLQKEKNEYAATINRLEGDIKPRDIKIKTYEDKIKELEGKLKVEEASIVSLQTQVKDMTQTTSNLNTNFTNEKKAKKDIQKSLNIVASWIENSYNHSTCCQKGISHSKSRFARILNVGDALNAPDVKLCPSDQVSSDTKYMSLSHCWKGDMSKIPLLTTKVYEEYLQRITITNLPKTFQDTIQLARHMGVQYLWIDSLCIIHDSKEDWQSQAAAMSSIYQKSYLNLVATKSTITPLPNCIQCLSPENAMALQDHGQVPYLRLENNTVLAASIKPRVEVTETKLDMNTYLGNRNGKFDPKDGGFSHSARNSSLIGPTLRAELRTVSGDWKPASIDLEAILQKVPNQPTIKFLKPSTLVVSSYSSVPDATESRLDLNECLGSINAAFDLDGKNFASNARLVSLTGTTLHAELKTATGSWQKSSIDLARLISWSSGTLRVLPPCERKRDVFYDVGPSSYLKWQERVSNSKLGSRGNA